MDTALTPFYEKFRVDDLLVFRSNHWSWSVRPVHSTLGSGVLSLNRYCERMSDMTLDEAADLARICKVIESTLDGFQSPDKMNYVMLMMVDLHLHFHVLPRYSRTINFAERQWTDTGWPAPPNMADNPDVDATTLIAIRDALKAVIAK